MQSNNPVFRRSEAFSGSGAHGNQSYGNSGYGSDPSQWGVGNPGDPQGTAYAPAPQAPSAPMTIDSVVQKTAITLGVVVVTAFATWVMLPEINESTADSAIGTVGAVATFGALGAFVLSMVNAFKKVVSPGLVLAFAALEGVALGAISMIFNVAYPGVVQGAVIGTFAAFAGTLAAYKVLNIQVGDKFRRFVIAAVFGMIGLSLMELVLGLFGAQIGLFGGGRPGARCVHADHGLRLRRAGHPLRRPRARVVDRCVRDDRLAGVDLHQPAAHPGLLPAGLTAAASSRGRAHHEGPRREPGAFVHVRGPRLVWLSAVHGPR